MKDYHRAVATNSQKMGTVRVGMSRSEVESAMGRGPVVDYKKVQLRNPWRTDSYEKDGNKYEVLYYVTSGETWSKAQSEEGTLTPVVLKNGKVIGTGWTLVDTSPRYVSGPFESK